MMKPTAVSLLSRSSVASPHDRRACPPSLALAGSSSSIRSRCILLGSVATARCRAAGGKLPHRLHRAPHRPPGRPACQCRHHARRGRRHGRHRPPAHRRRAEPRAGHLDAVRGLVAGRTAGDRRPRLGESRERPMGGGAQAIPIHRRRLALRHDPGRSGQRDRPPTSRRSTASASTTPASSSGRAIRRSSASRR